MPLTHVNACPLGDPFVLAHAGELGFQMFEVPVRSTIRADNATNNLLKLYSSFYPP
jgi:hypothetical protein